LPYVSAKHRAAAGRRTDWVTDVLKVDLHLHTAEDPVDRIPHTAAALIDRAADLGFGALAITLHDRPLEDPRLRDRARERGVVLIPGIERTIRGRHVLLLNCPPAAAGSVHTLDDVARIKARHGALVIAPHPFFPGRSCIGSSLDAYAGLFDAVEWSYFWTRGINFNRRAARWAADYGKPLVANSDLHDLRQLGRTFSWVAAAADPAAICEAIRKGRVVLRSSPVPPLELAAVFGGMMLGGSRRDVGLRTHESPEGRNALEDPAV